MRPTTYLVLFAGVMLIVSLVLLDQMTERRRKHLAALQAASHMLSVTGSSDLALSTEARYTRHPALTDGLVVGMDHPGALDHFPSGSFFSPVRL